MVSDAEKDGPHYLPIMIPASPKWGKTMRNGRIDELPQLWNFFWAT
jgi:lipopolysaccharide/colanic/teichoic acid biosynthesis glycosyltransferase